MTFTASATAQGIAYTNNHSMVTATASAMGVSEVSYQDALQQATNLAQQDANVTAQYDVNLINQAVTEATTVATQNIDYNTKQVNSVPDYTFYYSCSLDKMVYTKTLLGTSSLFSTYIGQIHSNIELTNEIGKWTSSGNIFNINFSDNGKYESTGLTNYYLPGGALYINTNAQVLKKDNVFVLPDNTYLYPIISGTGKFLGATGIVSLTSSYENLDRIINVYLN